MVWRNAGRICERKTLFRMKKEADQAGFKGTRTVRLMLLSGLFGSQEFQKNSKGITVPIFFSCRSVWNGGLATSFLKESFLCLYVLEEN